MNYIKLVITIFLFSTLIGNIVPTYAETICPNGLVSYWRLDETSGTTAMDSKDGNHGTVNNGEGWTTGKINNGFEFFGSQISIVAWFKADDFGVNDGRIVSKATSQDTQDHFFMLSTRGVGGGGASPYRMRFRLKLDGTTRTIIDGGGSGSDPDNVGGTNIDLVAGVWYFAVATYDGNDMRIYLNGQEIASTDRTGGISTSSANVWIGDNPGPDRKQFDGIIDEVAIYDRALTGTEILTLYNGGTGVDICTGGTCPAGLISYWRLDETSGTTATDSKDGNHGTVYSGVSWVPGKINNGLSFVGSGSNNYVDLGQFNVANNYIDLGNFDVTGTSLTIAAWFKVNSFNVNDGRIISKATDQSSGGHWWMLSTRGVGGGGASPYRMRFRLKTGGTTTTLVDGNPTGGGGAATDAISGTFVNLATDTWYFVVATYDGSYMRIYIDGTEVARTSKSGTINTNPAVSVWMGDNPGSDRKPFDGIVDEVSIFNLALSSTEINNLATAGKAICYMGDATNQYGAIQDIFYPRSAVYATGSGFVPNSLVDLYITTDQAWTDGMAITNPIRMTTVQADASGNIGPVIVWASADFGKYDLIFDTNQNGQYDVVSDLIGDVVDHPNHPGFSVSSLLTSTIVGGFYTPVNSLIVLAPYLIAALFIGFITSFIDIRRKKRG